MKLYRLYRNYLLAFWLWRHGFKRWNGDWLIWRSHYEFWDD